MSITCQECGRIFESIIGFRHLKYAHNNMTVAQYKEKWGDDSTRTLEYVERFQLSCKKGNSTPEARKNHRRANKEHKNRPEEIEATREKSLEVWQRPGYHEKMCVINAESATQPETQKKRSTSLLAHWKENEIRRAEHSRAFKVRNRDPKFLKAIKEGQAKAKAEGRFKIGKMSKPHLELKKVLLQRGLINFKSEQWVNYKMRCDEVDRVLGIVLEINGCYWHNCEICFPDGSPLNYQNVRDAVEGYNRKKEFVQKILGWQLLEIWEHDINNPKLLIKAVEKN